MRVRGDVEDGEVRRHVGVHQRQEGNADEAELAKRRRIGHGHQPLVAHVRAPRRHHHLEDGDQQRQDQREMPQLDNHCVASAGWGAPLPSLTPFASSAFATSGGM